MPLRFFLSGVLSTKTRWGQGATLIARLGVIFWVGLSLAATGCTNAERTPAAAPTAAQTVNAAATDQTKALLKNLHQLKGEGFLFGHQDTLAYGVEWWDEPGQSDVKAVTGDYPALYGWDLGHLERGDEANLDGVDFKKMQQWMREAHQRGGVVTVSWHMSHPGTGEGSWSTEVGAAELLPGGEHHQALKEALDHFAEFVEPLTATTASGDTYPIPLIIRPWHEHNGDWFWWGRGITSEQDYIALWRFTLDYLSEEKGLDQLLYAFSPDRSRLEMDDFSKSYLYGYPGDDYVDIFGIDNYWDLGHSSNTASREQDAANFINSLTDLVKVANERDKLAAMTEGGQDTLFEADFWSKRILPGLLANEWTRQITYLQVWRNANREREERDHFYVPHTGHPGESDFVEFYQHPASLFERDLPDLYSQP